MSNAQIVIYTTMLCGYCHAAKRLLKQNRLDFEEVDVAGRADLRAWLVTVSDQRTVPQIFINGGSIGGYRELSSMARGGQLAARTLLAPSADDSELCR